LIPGERICAGVYFEWLISEDLIDFLFGDGYDTFKEVSGNGEIGPDIPTSKVSWAIGMSKFSSLILLLFVEGGDMFMPQETLLRSALRRKTCSV